MNYNNMKNTETFSVISFIIAFFGGAILVYLISPAEKKDLFVLIFLGIMSVFAILYLYIIDRYIISKSTNNYYIKNPSDICSQVQNYINENKFLFKKKESNSIVSIYEKRYVDNIEKINRIYIYDFRNEKENSIKSVLDLPNILHNEITNKGKEKYYCNYIILLIDYYDLKIQQFLNENTFLRPFKIKNNVLSDERGDWIIPVAICCKDNSLYFGKTKSYPIIFEKRKNLFLNQIVKIQK